MTAKDVTDAIESQNAQIAVGQLGGTPSVDKQALNATINSQSLLQTPQQFRDITLRVLRFDGVSHIFRRHLIAVEFRRIEPDTH
ncbi:efflux RND transporter permease subunit [Klebsiella aerogenes]|uniref:efflux RND transporter permease subunit n=1 Tax=Klebsiella aerogenes TaxID=548 RepID=UPI0039B6F862